MTSKPHPERELDSEQQSRALVPERGATSRKGGGPPIGDSTGANQHSRDEWTLERAFGVAAKYREHWPDGPQTPDGRVPGVGYWVATILADRIASLEEQYAKAEQNAETLSDLADALRAERDGLEEQLETLREALVFLRECDPDHEATCAALWEPPSRAMPCDCRLGIIENALEGVSIPASAVGFSDFPDKSGDASRPVTLDGPAAEESSPAKRPT